MTLEQLIDACGGEMFTLMQTIDDTEYQWCAHTYKNGIHYSEYGSTPTEAVQKLYDYLKENNLI